MTYKRKTIVVLGAKGGLGIELSRIYADENVISLDIEELNITNESAVKAFLGAVKPDIVYNCAAYTDVDGAEDNKEFVEEINGYAVGKVAQLCANNSAIFVHFSSGMIFKGDNEHGYNENDPSDPVNFYGQSKFLGEQQIKGNINRFYLIRTSWLYGKDMGKKESFVDIMLRLSKQGNVDVVDDEFGCPTYIEDLAYSAKLMIEQKKPHGIYHIVNDGVASRYDLTKEIFRIKGINREVTPVKSTFFSRKANRPKFEVLNNTKFMKLRSWQDALEEYLGLPEKNEAQ